MRRIVFLTSGASAALLGSFAALSTPAAAQERAQTYHIICIAQDTAARVAHGTDVISETFATWQEARIRHEEITRRFEVQAEKAGLGDYRKCRIFNEEKLSTDRWEREVFQEYKPGGRYTIVGGHEISVIRANIPEGWEDIRAPGEKKPKENAATPEKRKIEPKSGAVSLQAAAEPDAATEAQKLREQREAEFQAKLAAHEAQVAEYQRKVKAREEEIARQQREHAAAQEAAARKLAAHRRELDEANRRQQEYFEAQRRHALCVNGERQWCDGAAGEQLADAGEASTDTDANRCVTTAEVRSNATFQGNTSASVMNGCGQKVDVRICLMRTGGWNCGTVWGVDPQGRATHSSFQATGEVFVDARVAGSSRPLASP